MKAPVDHDLLATYGERGFAIAPGLLSAEDVEGWRCLLDAAMAKRAAVPLSDRLARLDGENNLNASYVQYVNLHETDAATAKLVLDQRIACVAAGLAGVDRLRLWFASVLFKRPYADPLRVHLDIRSMPFSTSRMVTAWVSLDDVDETNGCMFYLPGSHLMGIKRAQRHSRTSISKYPGAFFDHYPEFRAVEPVFCPVTAGSVIFHNGMTIHGSTANLRPRRRRAISISYMPDRTICNGRQSDILPPGVAAGDLLDDERFFPLVHPRSANSPEDPG